MTNQRFADMSEPEFDQLLDDYIQRTATGYGEMPAEIFFDLLAERMTEQIDETLNLSIELVDQNLVISPDRELGTVVIRGNEILIGKHRLVLHLAT